MQYAHIAKSIRRKLTEDSTEAWGTSDDFRARALEQFRLDALAAFDRAASSSGHAVVSVVDCNGSVLDSFEVWWGEGYE